MKEMSLRQILISLFFAFPLLSIAQETNSIMEYIDTYKGIAMAEMKRTGVPASIKLAQGIHETLAGTSPLVTKSNNHFGIKCKTGWNGPSVKHDDDARNECFRKYESSEASYRDHSDFLRGSQRYAHLFNLDPTDYEGWAWGLKKAGYATNPKYAQTLIKLIEDYGLQQYSLIALGRQQADSEAETITEDAPESTSGEIMPVEKISAEKELPGKAVADKTTVEKAPVVEPLSQKEENRPIVTKPTERYPSGIFQQNGLRAIFVQAGTPYLAIANQCKIPLSRLFEYNEIRPATEAATDQVLYLEKKGKSQFHLPSLHKKTR